MRKFIGAVLLAAVIAVCGCSSANRFGRLGKSIAKNQGQTIKGALYSDTLVTDDGQSRLTGRVEAGVDK